MDNNTQTEERVSLDMPKRYKFTIVDKGESMPGKSDAIRKILISICNVDSLVAANAIRELNKNKTALVGIYSKQVASTMKRTADDYLSETDNRRFGLETTVEAE